MTKLKLGADVAALNPGVKAAKLPGKKVTNKAYLFAEAWAKLGHPGATPPVAEYPFSAEIGRKHKFDFAFTYCKLAVEVDGGQWSGPNGGRHNSDRDREKMNIAAMLGWRVMHFTPQQLTFDPAGCVDLVLKAFKYDTHP